MGKSQKNINKLNKQGIKIIIQQEQVGFIPGIQRLKSITQHQHAKVENT